jgi:cellulose synthase operon protein C
MRIVCQKCSAAYAIDDKLVTAKGVRAQCPRCKTLQLVKREDPPSPPAMPPFGAAPPAASSPFDFGTSAESNSPFDFGAPPPPEPASASPFDFGAAASPAPSPFDFGGSAEAAAAASLDFVAPPPPSPPGGAQARDAAVFERPAPAVAQASSCSVCGVALTDPFDQALGTCDDCRNKKAATASAGAGRVERIEQIEAAPPVEVPVVPSRDVPRVRLAVEPEAPTQTGPVRSAYRGGEGPPKSRVGVVLAIATVVVGLGVFLAIRRPWVKPPPRLVKVNKAPTKQATAIIDEWRLAFPELEGSNTREAGAFVSNGQTLLEKDTPDAYLSAENVFKKALVVDPSNDEAVAGWVLALAFGRGERVDEETAKAAESMLASSEKTSGSPRVYVAHALFQAVRGGNLNDVRQCTDRAQQSKDNADKALAELALAEAQLVRSPAVAEQNLSNAEKLDPKLKRTFLVRARLAQSQGRLKEAADAMEKRLELDADQLDAAELLARLYLDVGELQKAKRVLEKARVAAPTSNRAQVLQAMLLLQHQGDVVAATELLRTVVADPDVEKGDLSAAHVQLSAALRQANDLDGALSAAKAALDLTADSVPARLQHFLAASDKGVVSEARLDLEALKGKLAPMMATLLEGRLLMTEGRPDDAFALLSKLAEGESTGDKAKATEAEAARADVVFMAGASAMLAKKQAKGWELCLKRGLRMDPLMYPVQSLSASYVRPADILKPAVGAYAAQAPAKGEDPNPLLCEGLIAMHSQLYARATDKLTRVNAIDADNAEALALRSLIALQRGELASAQKLASKAVGASRNQALAFFAQAAASMPTNKMDVTKQAADTAVKLAPSLLGPKVLQGEIEAKLKQSEEARKYLTKVLLVDPTYRDAKRVLYRYGL